MSNPIDQVDSIVLAQMNEIAMKYGFTIDIDYNNRSLYFNGPKEKEQEFIIALVEKFEKYLC